MKPYLRVTLGYAIFGTLWVFFSDRLVDRLLDDQDAITFLQTLKGWLFVALSSLVVLLITKRAFEAHARTEREKLAVFQKTVEGSYHILLNYLNQMQLMTLEAERCAKFDREVLRLSNEAAGEAEGELKKLGAIKTITAEHINSVIYEKIRTPGKHDA